MEQKQTKTFAFIAGGALLLLAAAGAALYFICFNREEAGAEKAGAEKAPVTAAAEREKDKIYQKAVSFLQKADLSKPNLQMAISAAYIGDEKILDKLHENGFRQWSVPNILFVATRYGTVHLLQKLINRGADINGKFPDGLSPLHFAVYWGRADIVKYLAEKGADINARDDRGISVLHIAAFCGRAEIVGRIYRRAKAYDSQ